MLADRILDCEELCMLKEMRLIQNFQLGLIRTEISLEHVALFIECQYSLLLNVKHDLFLSQEVQMAVKVGPLLPDKVNDLSSWERFHSEEVVFFSFPDLHRQQSSSYRLSREQALGPVPH